ncbi:zinc finger HIT domain-containing protein 3-like isoform X1 [Salvia splendens]|uniref:zinc finger HIT domain-containing protein 3-like isoform X1 n=1 Tax=Salvia splendens TaxID=180675 RepID=UPI001C279050|nr:zinc finger HIT domain-containing protein 3-like isoform X1 [Salvia splendens]XP_042046676.1 zinc finger HIT domain-containing protein 3-like isoform X1 [Salvia splendens]XP_042046677.1 zinc finger HIT domain-containing protein 3-like isoform X1 [Salvia splendens]XP_042046678.1 zinc finger HIT domain-containing protein 3-like isoform X1 [Salvia splendens]
MGQKKCQVCDDAESKYKCPTCLITYCSVACFKKHKEVPCQKTESVKEEKVSDPSSTTNNNKPTPSSTINDNQPPPNSTTNDSQPPYVDEPSEVLQESQLQSVASSNEIRDLVKNEKLQKLIHSIDCSADPESELDKAMEEESFSQFAEKILSTIVPGA